MRFQIFFIDRNRKSGIYHPSLLSDGEFGQDVFRKGLKILSIYTGYNDDTKFTLCPSGFFTVPCHLMQIVSVTRLSLFLTIASLVLFTWGVKAQDLESQPAGVTPLPVELPQLPGTELPLTAEQPEAVLDSVLEANQTVMRNAGGSGRFGQPGPADRRQSVETLYLSRETPVFERFRQAMQYDQPTWQRNQLAGAGRFGQANALDYGEIEEGPGMVDILFPEQSRAMRERFSETDTGDATPEEELPPTFFSRLNSLFMNQVLADATLPFSIRNPGPDSANFPNSAYTLERGRIYIETQPVQASGSTQTSGSNYSWGYLLRFGLTDRVEFRLISNGFTHVSAFQGSKQSGAGPQQAFSGWSPLGIDFKINFWEQRIRSLIPAMGAEVILFTQTGSSSLQNGVAASATLLFDYNFGRGWNLEWNIGLQPTSYTDTSINYDFYQQFTAQWSLQKAITDDLAFYLHGYYGDAAIPRFGGNIVMGVGAIYYIGSKWSVWGNYNMGVEKHVGPPYLYNIGFAYAF